MSSAVDYVRGDATAPKGDGLKLILHCCNDIGVWGAGFVMALSNKWTRPEQLYRRWATGGQHQGIPFELGQCQYVSVAPDIEVVNMVAQQGTGRRADWRPPIDYAAVATCLETVRHRITTDVRTNISTHMPRFGAGLAGGRWELIELLIQEYLCSAGIPVTVYDLPTKGG